MQVKEIMTRGLETIDSMASLQEAAQKMRSLEIGALPVSEGDELVGMITDRDITIRATSEGKNPSSTSVNEVMTPEVQYCFENDDLSEAARIMEEHMIRRLLVLNSEGEPVGIMSLADLCVKSHDEHLSYEVFEQVSEPACPHR